MDTWILTKIRAASLRRTIAWCAALIGGVLLATSDHRYLNNFVRGPFELGVVELDSIRDVALAPRYFVHVSGSKVIDTGIRQYAVETTSGVETSRSESGAYYALAVGNKFLLTKQKTNPSGARTVVEGELADWPDGLAAKLFEDPEARAVRDKFYPFYVSNEAFRLPGYAVIGVALVFLFFFARKALPAWHYSRDPSDHPLVTRMAPWGNPMGVAVETEREFGAPRYKGGNGWRVGDKYLVRSTVFAFDLLRLQDLLWAYKKVTRHSINFIPTGKTYEAILVCYGGTAVLKGNERRVEEMLTFVGQRVPWAVLGYTPEIATLFKKKPADLASAVEQRRAEWAQKGQRPASG